MSRGNWRAASCSWKWNSTYFPWCRTPHMTCRSHRQWRRFCLGRRNSCDWLSAGSCGGVTSSSCCSRWTSAPLRFYLCFYLQSAESLCWRWRGPNKPTKCSSFWHSRPAKGSSQLRTFQCCHWFLTQYFRRTLQMHRCVRLQQSKHSGSASCPSWVPLVSTCLPWCYTFQPNTDVVFLRNLPEQKQLLCKWLWRGRFCFQSSRTCSESRFSRSSRFWRPSWVVILLPWWWFLLGWGQWRRNTRRTCDSCYLVASWWTTRLHWCRSTGWPWS